MVASFNNSSDAKFESEFVSSAKISWSTRDELEVDAVSHVGDLKEDKKKAL